MPLDPKTAKRRFIWRRGVLGLGLGSGVFWALAMIVSDRHLPLPWMLGLTFGLFPLVGYLAALRMWNQGRG
ncbi:MAG: hypothetical protein JKY61_07120 [Planctomycetes bacterium]|nr:hypothetical protein [Planctomycetota bacterium]